MSYNDIVFAELQKFWDAFDDAFLDQNAAYIDTGSILNIIELFTNRINNLTQKEKKSYQKNYFRTTSITLVMDGETVQKL